MTSATPPERGGSGRDHHRAKRSLGQNFLVDQNLQAKIVAAVGASPGEPVLEIGPGQGALTEHLVEAGVRLTAVELDDSLAPRLTERFAPSGARIVHGDVLQQDLPAVMDGAWPETRVVGNIPYNITTPIIFKLLERPHPRDVVLMVQAEVASRLIASPGTKAYGALAVGVRVQADVARLFKVPRQAFRPVPGVDSAIVRITPHRPPRVLVEDLAGLRRLTRAAFGWRRKQLQTILRKHPDVACPPDEVDAILADLGIPPATRPERLAPDLFVALSRRLFAPR